MTKRAKESGASPCLVQTFNFPANLHTFAYNVLSQRGVAGLWRSAVHNAKDDFVEAPASVASAGVRMVEWKHAQMHLMQQMSLLARIGVAEGQSRLDSPRVEREPLSWLPQVVSWRVGTEVVVQEG